MPGPGYRVGAPAGDTVYLADAPWDAWRFTYFAADELTNAAISGDLADPDGDRLGNLLEYAWNFDPRSPDDASGFHGALDVLRGPAGGSGLVVTFTRRLPPSDLRYEVEVSDDLAHWQSGPELVHELQRRDDGNGLTETVTARVEDSPLRAARFVRLKVTRP